MEGFRTRQMQVCWCREWRRTRRPIPPVGPRKRRVFEVVFVVDMMMVKCGAVVVVVVVARAGVDELSDVALLRK